MDKLRDEKIEKLIDDLLMDCEEEAPTEFPVGIEEGSKDEAHRHRDRGRDAAAL